jgi:tRNA-2-methylthio-N6-dimethylallyladenosine synthase
LIIVNTCAIREKAEQKVFSFVGRLAGMKKKKPNLIIGVGGCVAQQQGQKILKRVPFLDVVFGTHAIGRLARLIERVEHERIRLVDVAPATGIEVFDAPPEFGNDGRVTRFVTIMQGCDNYCTYCVVPYVRGREQSRQPDKIVEEIQSLVNCGVREVTLLGQNVNSYGRKEGLCAFAELLERVNAVDGLARFRFTTSHPKDLSTGLCRAFRDFDKLCSHIHLPVQSGSNGVLKRMNRRYTREHYLGKIAELRHYSPRIAVSSDFIVGFPGETGEDFEQTLDLIRTVQYDSLFAFKYSDRPDTPAAHFDDKVPEEEKDERLKALLDLQDGITLEKHRSLVGSIQEVLVEGLSKKQSPAGGRLSGQDSTGLQWNGRTPSNRIVNFEKGPDSPLFSGDLTGKLVRVKIQAAYAHSLRGTLEGIEPAPFNSKGDQSYAA